MLNREHRNLSILIEIYISMACLITRKQTTAAWKSIIGCSLMSFCIERANLEASLLLKAPFTLRCWWESQRGQFRKGDRQGVDCVKIMETTTACGYHYQWSRPLLCSLGFCFYFYFFDCGRSCCSLCPVGLQGLDSLRPLLFIILLRGGVTLFLLSLSSIILSRNCFLKAVCMLAHCTKY